MSEISEMTDLPASGVTVEEINAFLATEFAGAGNHCESVGERSAVARLDTAAVNLRPGGAR